jgi:CRP-like cAMP-binding protein
MGIDVLQRRLCEADDALRLLLRVAVVVQFASQPEWPTCEQRRGVDYRFESFSRVLRETVAVLAVAGQMNDEGGKVGSAIQDVADVLGHFVADATSRPGAIASPASRSE